MHFKELSHHYLRPGRQQYTQLLGKGGESLSEANSVLFLAFHNSTAPEQAGSSMLWQKGYKKLSSVPGSTAINGAMWGQVSQNCILKISSFI